MAASWLKSLSHKAAQVKLLHPLYTASLGKLEENLVFESFPPDLFGGDAGRGRWIASGQIDISGHRVYLDDVAWFIGSDKQNTPFFDKLHGFDCLLELKSLGGTAGRNVSREITLKWLKKFNNYNPITWSAQLTSQRLVNWLTAYQFAFESANDEFLIEFNASFYRQFFHLKYLLSNVQKIDDLDRFSCLWALIIIQCHSSMLRDDVEVNTHLQLLKNVMDDLFLDDGGLIYRNPQNLLEMAKSLLTLRHSLQQLRGNVPLWIDTKTDKILRTMNLLTHSDKDFPLFQGAVLPNKNDIEKVIKLALVRIRKKDIQLTDSGYTSIRNGKTSVIIDHGKADDHLSPLAFEMVHGGNRMIVSCGACLNGSDEWVESLSSFNAHSVLSIDNVDPKANLINCKVSLEKINGASLFIGNHEGYVADYGLTHTRRLYLDSDGDDFRGEDLLVRNIAIKPVPILLRFHLHPNVQASMIEDHSKILLRLPNGSGWVFYASKGNILLQDSVYCDDGFTFRKTKQIIVKFDVDDLSEQVKWAFKRQ